MHALVLRIALASKKRKARPHLDFDLHIDTSPNADRLEASK
jgi:hypothetical protein